MSVYVIGFNKFVTSYWKVFFIEYSITNVSLSLYRNIVNGTLADLTFLVPKQVLKLHRDFHNIVTLAKNNSFTVNQIYMIKYNLF